RQPRHADVAQDDVVLLAQRESRERVLRAGERRHGVLVEHELDRVADPGLVVDDENPPRSPACSPVGPRGPPRVALHGLGSPAALVPAGASTFTAKFPMRVWQLGRDCGKGALCGWPREAKAPPPGGPRFASKPPRNKAKGRSRSARGTATAREASL